MISASSSILTIAFATPPPVIPPVTPPPVKGKSALVYQSHKFRNQNDIANSNDAARWNMESTSKIQF